MSRLVKYFAIVILTVAAGTVAAQRTPVKARVSGLENNSEYMNLLENEQILSGRIDSLSAAMELLRGRFRTDSSSRDRISAQILENEETLFSLRGLVGELSERINAIEQQWIIMHLSDNPDTRDNTSVQVKDVSGSSVRYANLAYNFPIRDNLKAEDYALLLIAQQKESEAAQITHSYLHHYRQLEQLSRQYDTVSSESRAQRIMEQFDSLKNLCRQTEDSLMESWGYVFDNKTYAYSYIADKNDRSELLSEFEKAVSDMNIERNQISGQWASEAMTSYYLQKRVVNMLESRIANMFSLTEAADSLAKADASLREADYFLPPVSISERLFLDYEPLSVHSPSIYNSRNPIPECRIYPRGTIYRIQLGQFSVAQSPALFKGVSPISYLKENGRYTYFAGGFAADSSAMQAQTSLKEMGFKRPEIVVWNDGVYRNLSRNGAPSVQTVDTLLMRITISGISSVDDSLRAEISGISDRFDVLRSGQDFIIAPIEGRNKAERIQAVIRRARPEAVTEISVIEN